MSGPEQTLFDYIFETLSLEGWDFEYDAENPELILHIKGINYDFLCLLIVDEDQESILCYTTIDKKIPYSKRSVVCEFINTINYRLFNGNFEMDWETGDIRFRTFLDLANSIPSKEQILNMIWHGVQCFDTYYPGFVDILTMDVTASEAFNACID